MDQIRLSANISSIVASNSARGTGSQESRNRAPEQLPLRAAHDLRILQRRAKPGNLGVAAGDITTRGVAAWQGS